MNIQDVEFNNEINSVESDFKRQRRDHYLGLTSTPLGDNSYTDEQIAEIVEREWEEFEKEVRV